MTGPSPNPTQTSLSRYLRRVLLYTHNSVGLGHVVRCLAVISGMRRHRPDLDFLVITGSALPQVFLAERVEVLRLPGIRQDLEHSPRVFRPRLLTSLPLEDLVQLRQEIIRAAVAGFRPDAVLVEHYPAGLQGEALTLLGLEPAAQSSRDYVLAHIGRGLPYQPPCPAAGMPSLEDLLAAYDFLYVLNHPEPAAAENAGAREISSRLRYLGPVASRLRSELPSRHQALARFGLQDRGLVLISLGRGGPVLDMARRLLSSLPASRLGGCGVVMVLDPYLEPATNTALRDLARQQGVEAVNFVPYLVDTVAAADLVICRAGYNTITELTMTGAPALVVPERHPSGEQEKRCRSLPRDQFLVAAEEEIVSGGAADLLQRAGRLQPGAGRDDIDNYRVGRRVVEDLEAWLAARGGRAGA